MNICVHLVNLHIIDSLCESLSEKVSFLSQGSLEAVFTRIKIILIQLLFHIDI